MTVEEMAMRYAQSTGYLRGIIISMALHGGEITPSRFKHLYDALEQSYELSGSAMGEYDRERFNQRAKELGITL